MSVLTHSTLSRTSCETSFKQMRAQAVLDDSGCSESAFRLTCFLSHHAERKDAVLEARRTVSGSSSLTTTRTMFCFVMVLKDGEGSVDGRTYKEAQSLLRGHVGYILHPDSGAELRAASSGSSGSTLHDDETWIRPWITSISKHSGVRKQTSNGAFSTPPKATPRH